MKTTTLWATLFACGLALLAGCTKEIQDPVDNDPAGNETQTGPTRIGLTTEGYDGETRTSVKDNTVIWENGDEVQLTLFTNSSSTCKNFPVTVTNDGEAYIVVPNVNGYSKIIADYPADAFMNTDNSSYALTFPASYSSTIDGSGRQVLALPMVAYAENSGDGFQNLEFKHQTAAVKVMMWNATSSDLTVTRVMARSPEWQLNGRIFLTHSSNPEYDYSPSQRGSDASKCKVEVTFPDYGQSGALVIPAGDQTKSVQVPFRPIGEGTMTIEIHLTDGLNHYIYKYAASNPALTRNQMMTAKAKLDLNGNMRLDVVDLSALDPSTFPTDENTSRPYYLVSSGDILTGTFPSDCDLCIPDGATVTLAGVTHNGEAYINGITCLGSAKIILAPGTVNYLTGERGGGIFCDPGYTLTIEGAGTLNASGGEDNSGIGGLGNIVINGGSITATGGYNGGAGIGGASGGECGDITINGGNITAVGGTNDDHQIGGGAGIGAATSGGCSNITINGGTIRATGGEGAAGIGCGRQMSNCGEIIITDGVTSLTAIKGDYYAHCIGLGVGGPTNCDVITIDGIGFEDAESIDDEISDNFEHFNFTIKTTTYNNDTWEFIHK